MRRGQVFFNDVLAGEISELNNGSGYVYKYNAAYYNNDRLPAISVTLPKSKQEYRYDTLFPFFFNMLSEGANRKLQCHHLKIDEEDDFGLLLRTTDAESIGAITVKPVT
jgi:HipA-like protein